jgi:hypothetical protein
LRERWEQGVHNANKLLEEARARGYSAGSFTLVFSAVDLDNVKIVSVS